MPDVLHILVVLEHFEHLVHVLNFVLRHEPNVVLGNHLHLRGKELVALLFKLGSYGLEIIRRSINDKAFMFNPLSSDIYRYKIENGRLKYTIELTEDKGWGSLTKIEK